MSAEDDLFEYWLMGMSDAIDRFINGFSKEARQYFDYSPDSLDFLERWLIERYGTIELLHQQDQAAVVDGAARYVGQVFRRHLGGKWFIDNDDKKGVYYKRPQLSGMKGQLAQFSPLSLVTASLDRRTGNYMSSIFKRFESKAGKKDLK